MRQLIIKPQGPGLGDHLLFTPIPRIAKKCGYQRVFISADTQFRNPVYKHYIWELNPYVDGFIDGPATFDAHRQPSYHELFIKEGNIIDQIIKGHGLDDKEMWHKPELYFQTKAYEQYKNANVLDPCFYSLYVMNYGEYQEKIIRWIKKNGIKIDYQIISTAVRNIYMDGLGERLVCDDFFEYCSIVKSCRSFLCLFSGSILLAVAMGKRPTVLYYGVPRDRALSYYLKKLSQLWQNFLKDRSVPNFTHKLTKGIRLEMQDEIIRHKRNPKMFLESDFVQI